MLQHDRPDAPGLMVEPDIAAVSDEPSPPRRRRRYFVVLLLGLVIAAAGTYALGSKGDRVSYPGAWDPRVAELVDWVAAERGLSFKHPVYIDFVSEVEFKESLLAEEAKTEDRRQQLEDSEALVRSIGLPLGEASLFDSVNSVLGEGYLAYYSPRTKRITVKGAELSAWERVVLAHELVHVLQDQHFDLTRLDGSDSDAQDFGLRAVVEGDANRIQAAYVKTLGADERAAAEESAAEAGDTAEKLAGVPHWLISSSVAPYALGEQFAYAVLSARSRRALDDAIRRPPVSEEQVYDVVKYLTADEPATVEATPLRPGDREIDRGDFGTLTLMFMLAEHLPALDAVRAAEDWDGDAYVSFERDGKVCTAVAFMGDSDTGAARLDATLERWTQSRPAGAASVTRTGRRVDLVSCEPGGNVPDPARDAADVVMTLLANRAALLAKFLQNGLGQEPASCIANRTIEQLTVEEIASDTLLPGVQDKMLAIGADCVAPSS